MFSISSSSEEPVRGVIITTGESYADTLSAAGLAGLLDYSVLLTPKDSLSPYAAYALLKLYPETVIVIGGEGVISATGEQELQRIGLVEEVVRIGGSDRYETAQEIYAYGAAQGTGWGGDGNAVVVSGAGFADGISISSYAAYKEASVFLVDVDGALGDFPKSVIGNFQHIFIAGGTGVVSAETEQFIEDDPSRDDREITRFCGADRYETCLFNAKCTNAQVVDDLIVG